MEKEKREFLEVTIPNIEKERNVKVLLAYVRGSHMYGTNVETSDVDMTFVYQQPTNSILRGDYKEQINYGGNDIVGYEIQRYIHLLSQNNPNIIESLDIPEDCIIYKDPSMNVFEKEKWVSKLVKKTILGYADSQIKKATGLNKNMNNPQPKQRKDILDFCYIIQHEKTIEFKKWYDDYRQDNNNLSEQYLDHNNWGLSKYPVGKGLFSLWMNYDQPMRGLIKDPDSVQLRLSEIPEKTMKDQFPLILYYNLDGFEVHCKQHKAYWKWVEERNEERFNMNQKAGQGVDLKNMMHLFRLLEMCENIAKGNGLQVRSKNVEYLLDIRKGKYDYNDLMKIADQKYEEIKKTFETTDLIENVDIEYAKDLLLKFRK